MQEPSNFYLGLPQVLWDDLLYEAEKGLEEELLCHAHILGLYPYGPRLLGLEFESPGFLCIYMETSTDRLLDPFAKEKFIEPNKITVRNDGSFIYYVDFWSWLSSLDQKIDFIHLIPCYGDACHEDTSIKEIIDLATDFINAGVTRINPQWTEDERDPLLALYNKRTMVAFVLENIFCPNTNPQWGEVANIDKHLIAELVEADNALVNKIPLSKEKTKNYSDYLQTILRTQSYKGDFFSAQNKLRKEAISYFRFQL